VTENRRVSGAAGTFSGGSLSFVQQLWVREEAHIGWAGGATGDRALGVGQALSHEDATAEGSQVGIIAWRHNRH
jgi:hypothetical protein